MTSKENCYGLSSLVKKVLTDKKARNIPAMTAFAATTASVGLAWS